jgi:hypothetical protein
MIKQILFYCYKVKKGLMRDIKTLLEEIKNNPVKTDAESENVSDGGGLEYDIDENGKIIGEDEDGDKAADGDSILIGTGNILTATSGSWSPTTSVTWNGSSNSYGWDSPTDELKEQVVDVERIKGMDSTEREIILSLLNTLATSDTNLKRTIMDTLEIYKIFGNKKAIHRKKKIKDAL